MASIHADIGPMFVLVLIWQGIAELGSLALLIAAYIFWKKQQFGWLFACVALATLPGMLMRLTAFARLYDAVATPVEFITALSLAGSILYWIILLVAIFINRKAR
ncbi:hypothetical protein JCM14076_00100 [Methylosoma difficile]